MRCRCSLYVGGEENNHASHSVPVPTVNPHPCFFEAMQCPYPKFLLYIFCGHCDIHYIIATWHSQFQLTQIFTLTLSPSAMTPTS